MVAGKNGGNEERGRVMFRGGGWRLIQVERENAGPIIQISGHGT